MTFSEQFWHHWSMACLYQINTFIASSHIIIAKPKGAFTLTLIPYVLINTSLLGNRWFVNYRNLAYFVQEIWGNPTVSGCSVQLDALTGEEAQEYNTTMSVCLFNCHETLLPSTEQNLFIGYCFLIYVVISLVFSASRKQYYWYYDVFFDNI